MKSLRKFEGFSQDKINKAIEEILLIQALKDSLNPLSGISPYFPEERLYEHHMVPFVSYTIPTSNYE